MENYIYIYIYIKQVQNPHFPHVKNKKKQKYQINFIYKCILLFTYIYTYILHILHNNYIITYYYYYFIF